MSNSVGYSEFLSILWNQGRECRSNKPNQLDFNRISKFERQTDQFFSKEKLQNAENTIAKAQVQVKVINVDEPPVVSERRLFVDENLAPGTAIANSSGLAADPEGDSFR